MDTKYLTRAFLILIITMLAFTAGCGNPQETRDRWAESIKKTELVVETLSLTAEQLIASIEAVQVQVVVLPDGSVKDDMIAGMTRAQTELTRILEKRDTMNEVIIKAKATLNSIDADASGPEIALIMAGEAVAGAAPLVPPPIGTYAAILGTVLGGFGTLLQRDRRKKIESMVDTFRSHTDRSLTEAGKAVALARDREDIAKNLIHSIELVKEVPQVREVWNQHIVPILNLAQTTETRAMVKSFKPQKP